MAAPARELIQLRTRPGWPESEHAGEYFPPPAEDVASKEPSVIEAAQRREGLEATRPEAVFGVIRRWKDSF